MQPFHPLSPQFSTHHPHAIVCTSSLSMPSSYYHQPPLYNSSLYYPCHCPVGDGPAAVLSVPSVLSVISVPSVPSVLSRYYELPARKKSPSPAF